MTAFAQVEHGPCRLCGRQLGFQRFLAYDPARRAGEPMTFVHGDCLDATDEETPAAAGWR